MFLTSQLMLGQFLLLFFDDRQWTNFLKLPANICLAW